ncbi:hypothetical protein CRENBAI_009355 [Crenichthys baileyi]|uniref:Uncharacterized protein n=1 Tax=Crenichthys baileyi TaxID=28760 RepID=A0AAV9SCB1_9TELE
MHHIDLFKLLNASTKTIGMFSHHNIQEGDGFYVPEINVFWLEKQKPLRCWLKLARKHHYPSPVPTWAKRPLCKKEASAPKNTKKKLLKNSPAHNSGYPNRPKTGNV